MSLIPKKTSDEIGLIGHTIINYPDTQTSKKIIEILIQQGADLIELQIPFSEPVADGPLFVKANHEVITNGISTQDCFDLMKEMTSIYPVPFVFMTYANIVYKHGAKNFIYNAKNAGAKGMIIPDLPLDYVQDLLPLCKELEFYIIPVLSPNMPLLRLQELSTFFSGFIYAVARAGVTGAVTTFNQEITDYVQVVRKYTSLPIAMGFGITSGNDIAFLRGKVDYAVIGTQTLRAYQAQGLLGVEKLWQEFSKNKNEI